LAQAAAQHWPAGEHPTVAPVANSTTATRSVAMAIAPTPTVKHNGRIGMTASLATRPSSSRPHWRPSRHVLVGLMVVGGLVGAAAAEELGGVLLARSAGSPLARKTSASSCSWSSRRSRARTLR